MNRKIVFRGKCVPDSKYAGEWVTGGYVPLSEGITPNDEGLIVRFLGDNNTITYHVAPNTIGQFTGLQDSNGNDIYEGDIIRSFDSTGLPIIHSIVWLESCAKFVAQLDSDSKYGRTCCDLDKDWIDEFCKEVIGNIHDNPELLKGGEK